MTQVTSPLVAFVDDRLLAAGSRDRVLEAAKRWTDAVEPGTLLIFEEDTGSQVDFDLRGTAADVLARANAPVRGRGRPKLGVISREVTLLPQHWAWLAAQPNGASASLRRLVDAEMRRAPEREAARRARDAVCRLMTAMAGNRAGFEEAMRVLFAGDAGKFRVLVDRWPKDVSTTLQRLAKPWFDVQPGK